MARQALNEPAELPRELDRWNWGAFFLNWIWGIGNSTFIALLALIPGLNLIVMIVLGARGSRWAWRNRAWRDAEHFRRSQRKWAIAGLIAWILVIGSVPTAFLGFFGALKTSGAYHLTMETLRANDAVKAAFGTHIRGGFWTEGSVSLRAGGSGSADFRIPLRGSRASGTALSHATRIDGKWHLTFLVVRVDGSNTPIVIVNGDHIAIPDTLVGT